MLHEISCDKFQSYGKIRKPIKFHNGLNIIQGQNTGENSIGKSTFLLVIDFCFGGNTYAENENIIKNIGHHSINFCFIFNNIKYYFQRNTKDIKHVAICDNNYTAINRITLDSFKKQLSQLYEINIKNISFRQVIGSYFRIYGKGTSNEFLPFASYSGESQETSLISLLKMYNSFDVLDNLNNTVEDKKQSIKTLKDANNYNFIEIIKQKQYNENKKRIEELNNELKILENKGKEELTNTKTEEIEHGAKLKAVYNSLNRQKGKLWNDYYKLKETIQKKQPASQKEFDELLTYFPHANLQLLKNIERFHCDLTTILNNEFKQAQSEILREIDNIVKQMKNIEKELNSLDIPLQLSEQTLKTYAKIQNEIMQLEKTNKYYERKKELENDKKRLEKSYSEKFIEQSSSITKKINDEIEKLNVFIYGKNIEAPKLNIEKPNSYTYSTPSDDGTGTNNKNLILLDLSMLKLTPLPAIAHDTIIFKHISQQAIGKILQLYTKYQKQIFITIDETNKYPQYAQEIIKNKKVLELSNDGNELYGSSWSKKTGD